MKNKFGSVLLGIFFLIIGVGFAGEAFNLWNFEPFFNGWWTLFIIVPCIASMMQNGINTGNAIGLLIGVVMLLSAQNIVSWAAISRLILPSVFIILGLSIIFRGFFSRGFNKTFTANASGIPEYFAFLSGNDVRINNERFIGANINAIFGGVELDLRNSVIDGDAVINATAIFGGIDILVPAGINVKTSGLPLFGGAANRCGSALPNSPTLYINYTAMFGGVEIK